jgi:hypothetical protein
MGGQLYDITQPEDLIADFKRVIAERSYDAEEFLLHWFKP